MRVSVMPRMLCRHISGSLVTLHIRLQNFDFDYLVGTIIGHYDNAIVFLSDVRHAGDTKDNRIDVGNGNFVHNFTPKGQISHNFA